ncbi:MAG: response regulator transcription factor [Bacteriovoracia bacterium]
MKIDDQVLITELKRLSRECRLQAKGTRPAMALQRLSASLISLIASLDQKPYENSPLTQRERDVLFQVSQGFTNREIASAYNLSEKTIEFHLKSIFKKTETDRRTEAVKKAILNKWIEP